MIPDSFKQELLHRVDIVDVIERHVPLKKGGANYSACCPFHSEKSPSFTVSPTKQFYHCFGCGAHGNAVSFLMEYSGLGYVDAIKDLADSAGMKLPDPDPRFKKAQEPDTDLYELMQRASDYYREQLKASPRAIEYLKGRGLTGKIAARFGIGYAPDGWQNLQSVFADYAAKALKDAGLVVEAEGGRRYDRFRDRVMFPIFNQRGSVIAFGGRILNGGQADENGKSGGPKYLNSPETPLFEKGLELYGLSQARQAIRASGRVIVVEGYMDVVALAQHGVEYAVATLGTATSATHVQKLLRQVDEVVFCFDGDAAGRKAAWHALEVSLPHLVDHKTVRFLFLPAEHDPDSFVRAHGKAGFEASLEEARPLSAFFVDELRSRVDVQTAEGRSRLMHEAKPLLKAVVAPALQMQLLKTLADAAQVSREEAAQLFEIRMPRQYVAAGRPAPARGRDRVMLLLDRNVERGLLRCLMANPDLLTEMRADLIDVSHPEGKALQALTDLTGQNALAHQVLIETFRGSEHEALLNRVREESLQEQMEPDDAAVVFRDALRKLEIGRVEAQLQVLARKAAAGQTTAEDASAIKDLAAKRETLRRSGQTTPNVL
jgi:DNA primase